MVYMRECAGSCLVGWPWKRWIDNMKDYLKKEFWISGKQGEGFMSRGSGFYGGECLEYGPGDKPLTLMRCQSFWLP